MGVLEHREDRLGGDIVTLRDPDRASFVMSCGEPNAGLMKEIMSSHPS